MGKTQNNLNITGLMVLIALTLPSTLLDIVFVFRMFLSIDAWITFTGNINISPDFGLWGLVTLFCNGTMMFILIRSIRSRKDKRIDDNADLKQ